MNRCSSSIAPPNYNTVFCYRCSSLWFSFANHTTNVITAVHISCMCIGSGFTHTSVAIYFNETNA